MKPCRTLVYDTYGEVWAERTSGAHDWRLISERVRHLVHDPAPGAVIPVENVQRWYCAKCRTIEETTS